MFCVCEGWGAAVGKVGEADGTCRWRRWKEKEGEKGRHASTLTQQACHRVATEGREWEETARAAWATCRRDSGNELTAELDRKAPEPRESAQKTH